MHKMRGKVMLDKMRKNLLQFSLYNRVHCTAVLGVSQNFPKWGFFQINPLYFYLV